MVPLILVACLSSQPDRCEQMVLAQYATLLDCRSQIEAQSVLWARDHKDKSLSTAYCLPARAGS